MVVYTTALGDLEMGAEENTVVLVEKKSPTGWIWKVSGVLLSVTLCLGGILFLAWYWNGRLEMMESSQRVAPPEEVPAEKADPHRLRQLSSKAKAAIHLEGEYDESLSKSMEWKSEQGQAFVQGGFRIKNNNITIPHSGLYFVYSQASFRISCGDGDEEGGRNTPLSHRIWRFSESIGSRVCLMSAIRSVCQSPAQEDGRGTYSAIYLGAVFKLNRGDKLWTETNQLSQLETEDGQTFFGVFAL